MRYAFKFGFFHSIFKFEFNLDLFIFKNKQNNFFHHRLLIKIIMFKKNNQVVVNDLDQVVRRDLVQVQVDHQEVDHVAVLRPVVYHLKNQKVHVVQVQQAVDRNQLHLDRQEIQDLFQETEDIVAEVEILNEQMNEVQYHREEVDLNHHLMQNQLKFMLVV